MELLKGTLDAMVLKALTWGPRHGYAVSRWIHGATNELLDVDDAALYQALHRLERRRLLESEWGLSENNRRAKYYALTAAGRAELESEVGAIRRYVDALLKVLNATGAGA
ncbi:MAG TPA: PadR family transcriptional regulator [Longimicrobiales bacterium]|nr:PadR family transcriptional regulator [Longimicrobiales bacterium]